MAHTHDSNCLLTSSGSVTNGMALRLFEVRLSRNSWAANDSFLNV